MWCELSVWAVNAAITGSTGRKNWPVISSTTLPRLDVPFFGPQSTHSDPLIIGICWICLQSHHTSFGKIRDTLFWAGPRFKRKLIYPTRKLPSCPRCGTKVTGPKDLKRYDGPKASAISCPNCKYKGCYRCLVNHKSHCNYPGFTCPQCRYRTGFSSGWW